MTLPRTTLKLQWVDRETGTPHATTIDAISDQPIRRTLGSSGDAVTLSVNIADWPAGFTDDGEFRIIINDGQGAGSELTLAGYTLRQKLPFAYGRDIDDASGDPTPRQYRIVLKTDLSMRREGYGNLITADHINTSLGLSGPLEEVGGTLNGLDANGYVDTTDDFYKTNQELVQVCLDALGMTTEAAPAELNTALDGSTVDAPGPLDWGNARPLTELEDLLSRIGWSVVQLNDGTVAVRRLLRAGQAVEIPTAIDDVAEPYAFGTTPGVRCNKIVVTSGATRATVITSRALSIGDDPEGINPLEWVTFDTATNQWSEQGSGAIDTYKAGLTPGDTTPGGAKALGQLFRAVRLTGTDLARASSFVNIPTDLDTGDFAAFAGAPGVVEARCCVKLAGDQLLNVPPLDTDDPVRIDGLRAIPGQGVFILPPDAEFVRLDDGLTSGRRGDARELEGDDLTITFAHESNSGVFKDDYFVVGFTWDIDGGTGAITVTAMDQTELDAALADPGVVKVAAPILRRVVTQQEGLDGSGDPHAQVSLNSTELIAIAKQIAISYLGSAAATAGPIELRGIIDINPGDIDGGVSSVAWDHINHRTIITINQHEMPDSYYDKLQRIAGRSITSGIKQLRLDRSSASLGDLRSTLVADGRTGGVGTHTPESAPALRGRTKSMSGMQGSLESGPRARAEMATIPEQSRIYAQITGSTPNGDNRWDYDWEEVRFEGGDPVSTDATRTSATHGVAMNTMEMLNSNTGVQGNGIDLANLTGTFAIKPISTQAVVELTGPFDDDGDAYWLFQAVNQVDGGCP